MVALAAASKAAAQKRKRKRGANLDAWRPEQVRLLAGLGGGQDWEVVAQRVSALGARYVRSQKRRW